MPGKQTSKAVKDFCEKFNADETTTLVLLLLANMTGALTTEEQDALVKAGYSLSGDLTAATNGPVTINKIQLRDDVAYLKTVEGESKTMFASLDTILVPSYVEEFVADVIQRPGQWGKSGPDGLMYRGHNLFDIYWDKHFNEQIIDLIKNDQELRDRNICDEKCRMFVRSLKGKAADKGKCEFAQTMIEAAEKCCEANRIKPEDITTQEVYLGYSPGTDTFHTAWDVFGSDNTGCVIVCFRIDEEGIVRHASHDEYDKYRDDLEICDASSAKFYQKNSKGPAHDKSMYECVSSIAEEKYKIIDIRLD